MRERSREKARLYLDYNVQKMWEDLLEEGT
jgi:hypothetical protein